MLEVNKMRYVHYNEKGELEKISKNRDERFEAIHLDFESVRSLIEGRESLSNYKVEYDFIDKKHKLKSLIEFNNDQVISAFMYEIPSTANEKEISIIQDMKNKCWRLELDKSFLKHLEENNIDSDPTSQFYSITKKHDPNILYRLIKFNDTQTIPFEYDFEFDLKPISIYTTRKFSSYVYEVIN